jgi:DNA-binding transcriptional MerR regulator
VALTIDELASSAGTSTRNVRSFQTMGLLERPGLKGRTGQYTVHHLERLRTILRLQAEGYSLHSLGLLFAAYARGDSLGAVLGLGDRMGRRGDGGDVDGAASDWAESHGLASDSAESDMAELYGFAELQAMGAGAGQWSRGRRRPLLAIVPTTMWDQPEAS